MPSQIHCVKIFVMHPWARITQRNQCYPCHPWLKNLPPGEGEGTRRGTIVPILECRSPVRRRAGRSGFADLEIGAPAPPLTGSGFRENAPRNWTVLTHSDKVLDSPSAFLVVLLQVYACVFVGIGVAPILLRTAHAVANGNA